MNLSLKYFSRGLYFEYAEQFLQRRKDIMSESTQVAVIGAGPGGYVAAIKAAQLGKEVTIIEKEYYGGVCLNVGCIPSKALITAARKYDETKDFDAFGLPVPEMEKIDYSKVQDFKNKVVTQLTGGVESLLKANKVSLMEGTASFKDADTLTVETADGEKELAFKECILATGSRPMELPDMQYGNRVVSSTEALAFEEIPESLIVIGGGVIGIELAFVYADFGSKVTILEATSDILPPNGKHITSVVKKSLKQKGVDLHTDAFVESAVTEDDKTIVKAKIKDEVQTFEANYTMVSVGRTPNTENIGLENADIEVNEHGVVRVDEQGRTSASNVFAIGDIIPGPQLAHKATYEAKVVAEVIAGQNSVFDYRTIPSAVFSNPEIATTGLSEEAAKEQGYDTKTQRFPFGVNGRAIAMNETAGFVNIIADAENGKVLGGEIVGPSASDLINEITVAIESSLTAEDLALTIHPHPTLGEVVMEAAEGISGKPIHIL